ncbi:MAG: response regulator, partial [Methanolinea sp.]
MIRVLVVDDSLFMRTMIRDMLEKDPEIDVVATATDGVDALKKIRDFSPDVVTLDIEMPRMNGLEVLKNRSQFKEFPKVMMLSSLTSVGAEMTRTAMQLGADDFMPKPTE